MLDEFMVLTLVTSRNDGVRDVRPGSGVGGGRHSRPSADISDTELRVRIFERTYGSDFDAADAARIGARIRASGARQLD
jgi:hypothetical protein